MLASRVLKYRVSCIQARFASETASKIKYAARLFLGIGMTSNLLDKQLGDLLAQVLADADDEVIVVNPSADAIEDLIRVATDFDGVTPEIHMLADERTLKGVMDDFIVASHAADLIDDGTLTLRTTEDAQQNSLLVTGETAVALVDAGSHVGGLTAADEEFVDAAYDTYATQWEEADEFHLRTPPITRVRETLAEEISPEAQEDFTGILDTLETARGDGDGLDEVTISLLVAAKNEALLYDISKWGEDVGIASKATFSRTKTKLEDMGLLDTEKVPIDVGRPRLRLKLGDERLSGAEDDQVASVAQSILN